MSQLFGVVLLMVTGVLVAARQTAPQPAYLAFESLRDGNPEIYLWHAGRLTNWKRSPDYEGRPAFSPDMRWIIYLSGSTGNFDMFIRPVFGKSPPRNLTNTPTNESNPAFSPDGQWVVFDSTVTGNSEIYQMRVNGTGLQNLTDHPSHEVNAVWSSGGIVFESNRDGKNDLYLMSPDGTGIFNLTNELGYDGAAAWSSDGQQLAFMTGREITPQIYLMQADGSQPTRLTDGEFPTWAGEWIAFDLNRRSNREVWRIRADGTGLENLSQHPAYDGNAAWSPIIDLDWQPFGTGSMGLLLLLFTPIRRCVTRRIKSLRR